MQDADGYTSPERVPTGIAGLDRILHGGLFAGAVYIVRGDPGAGKTILANQMCFLHCEAGRRALYVTLLAESHARMMQHMSGLDFFNPAHIPERLSYISAFGVLEADGAAGLLELLRREMRRHRATLLVIDGLAVLEENSGSDRAYRKLIHELQAHADAQGCVVLLLTNGSRRDFHPEHTMVDGLITLEDVRVGKRAQRELEVRKFRGSASLRGRHTFRIDASGVVVHPRFEAQYGRSPEPAPTAARVGIGVDELDVMLGGGLPEGSTTLLVGPSGAGKTSLGLHFLAQSTPQRPGLLFGFYEEPERLKMDAQGFGLDFEALERCGVLQLLRLPPAEGILDDLGARLLSAVRARGAKRVLIAGLGGFMQAIDLPERLSGFFSALAHELRALGVTTIFTAEIDKVAGPEAFAAVDGISAIAENLILLRYVERDARLHRLISILKTRGSDFDGEVRAFTLSEGRLRLAGMDPARGLLSAPPAMPAPAPTGVPE